MKVWMIWVQGDDATWLENAMDDDSTAETGGVWEELVKRVEQMCVDNGYVMRIQAVNVPGVYEMFEIPTVDAEAAS